MPRAISLVVAAACESNWGIGLCQQIPWRLPTDMKHFKNLTVRPPSDTSDSAAAPVVQHAVIMGRKTWESLPPKFRPLPHRFNVILTRNADYRTEHDVPSSVGIATSLPDALDVIESKGAAIDRVFVIGGSAVYAEALAYANCETVYLTHVFGTFECDAFFPSNVEALGFETTSKSDVIEENGIQFAFHELRRSPVADTKLPADTAASDTSFIERSLVDTTQSPHEELQYLDLIRKILRDGVRKSDRTGTGTISLFGAQMRFSLRDDTFPMLTTKRVFWRGVAEELLWFISGDTNAKTLQDKDIHIWDGNGSRAYLDSIGLIDRETGDLGPVYGFQWRHFGASYTTMHADYNGKGVDQLAAVIEKLRTNPNDRRIVLSAWNPIDLNAMALPPCHMFCQFYVGGPDNNELSCQMYQRSADMGLGVPFNIASYALLTRLIAHVCGLNAGDFIHVIGDAHVYVDHIEPLEKQLTRTPRAFPKLHIHTTDANRSNIDGFVFRDLEVVDYKPHGAIKMAMSV